MSNLRQYYCERCDGLFNAKPLGRIPLYCLNCREEKSRERSVKRQRAIEIGKMIMGIIERVKADA